MCFKICRFNKDTWKDLGTLDKLESAGAFDSVKEEFEAIAGIVEISGTWQEVE